MIKKFLHIFLAFAVLVSASGFVITQHYCQEELKSTSLWIKAQPCHEQVVTAPSCPFHPPSTSSADHSPQENGCCNDKVELVKLDTAFHPAYFQFHFAQLFSFIGLVASGPYPTIPVVDAPSSHFHNYKPPLLVYDLPVSLQTFLC